MAIGAFVLAGSLAGCGRAGAADAGAADAGNPDAGTVACRADELSPMAVMSSPDHGVTWHQLGRICYHDPSILSVDCTALRIDGGIALYFVDMKLLGQAPTVERIIYRAVTHDGVDFDQPQAVLTSTFDMVDPTVVRTPEGKVRLYVPTFDHGAGLVSAISDDGVTFTREGVRVDGGGFPGALILDDHRVRLFVTNPPSTTAPGIYSLISDDGLNFVMEGGLRFAAAGPRPQDLPFDASPLRLLAGTYLMAYALNPSDPTDAVKGEYRLATSSDGLGWTTNPRVFATGGTSCLVEASDGTLFFYYGQ
jgi:hypothetical protein